MRYRRPVGKEAIIVSYGIIVMLAVGAILLLVQNMPAFGAPLGAIYDKNEQYIGRQDPSTGLIYDRLDNRIGRSGGCND